MASELREKVNLHMRLRGFSPRTVESYTHAYEELARYYMRPLDTLSCNDVQGFLDNLVTVRKLEWSTINVYFSSYRLLYEKILEWDEKRFSIPRRGRSRKRPGILSQDEVKSVIRALSNVKHRALLAMIYGSGLRVSEAVVLRPVHIERSRMMLRVEQGKRHKDRYTILSPVALELLETHWKLEGQLGYVAVLHTWTQKLLPHYHIHCLVPGGAWSEERGEWRSSHPKYLFGKDALCAAFRARFIKRLKSMRKRRRLEYTGDAAKWEESEHWDRLIEKLLGVKWVVYPKATSSGPDKVLEYLGRYTHKVAISDHRILDVSDGKVTFTWRDRSEDNEQKKCTLPVEQFIARFIHHILPPGFRKIRYMGFLASRGKADRLTKIRAALKTEPPENQHKDETLRERILRRTGTDIALCPNCKKGNKRKRTIA